MLILIFSSFFFEFIDSAIGMGYGTSLTPFLILLGFSPKVIVPCILFSEFITGILAGLFHHIFGNVRFDFRKDEVVLKRLSGLGYIPKSEDAKVSYFLVIFGVIGAIISSSISINLPKEIVTFYIAIMVTGIGAYIIINLNRNITFKWKTFIFISLLSGFNKGISAGGYGPLVAGGQIISGRNVKSSIGTTSFAEGFISFVSFSIYAIMGRNINFKLIIPLLVGSLLSVPFSALFVKKAPEKSLKFATGLIIIILGISNIFKLF
ncbi:MAG: sulfite exporter TauE/SafE family protein [Candidatus Hydrothermales bacterium]